MTDKTDNTGTEKIKPCPFCGDIPDNYVNVIAGRSQNMINCYVICRKCEIKKSISIQSGLPIIHLYEANNKLIEEWNTRKEGG